MGIKAYLIDNPSEAVSEQELKELGVFHWVLDAEAYEKDNKLEALDKICQERGYNYRDFVNSEKIPNLKEKLATFNEEHLHDDEEIRFFLGGSGYFDVKSKKDKWIRMECKRGDLIILPAGIYHRFVPDEKLYFYVMRLFCGEPVWTPYNRADPNTDGRQSRQKYAQTYIPMMD